MPEGHTIHRLARDHERELGGRKIVCSSPQGRFEEGAKQLSGRKLQRVEAVGKHLCYEFSGGRRLHIHLGLYGKFRRHSLPAPEPRGAVRWRMAGGERGYDLNGPNRCELISKQAWLDIRARLGPDPLRSDADPELVWLRVSRSRAAIGKLLLDQSVVAGVGNVYRSEVLFLLGIHPERPGNQIRRQEFDELWSKVVELMEIGVKYNRIIIAAPDDVGKPRGRMTRQERLLVYKHQHCVKCDGVIDDWELAARRAYACPRCQT